MEDQAPPGGESIPAAASPPSGNDLVSVQELPGSASAVSPVVVEGEPAPPPDQLPPASGVSEDLRRKIIKQVEYYFSDENLPNDTFLLKYVKDYGGFVPIRVIATFNKMKKLTKDTSVIAAALRESALLVVSSNGKRVKRLHPLSLADLKDPLVCTVLVENLPENHSSENLRQIFSEAGKIKNITIRNPENAKESHRSTVAEKLLSGKLHALVEYDSVESAEKAVATLNDEQDWRYGLRVKLLKKTPKENKKKNSKKTEIEKYGVTDTADIPVEDANCGSRKQHMDSVEDEDEDGSSKLKSRTRLPKEMNAQKGRSRGRGRRTQYHPSNMQGHATETFKPPPGPRMPDGTRGFTLGRGKPTL